MGVIIIHYTGTDILRIFELGDIQQTNGLTRETKLVMWTVKTAA